MENKSELIIKGKFNRAISKKIRSLILVVFFSLFASLFFVLGFGEIKSNNYSSALFAFCFCVTGFGCAIFVALVESSKRNEKIEVYADKLIIKYGFSKEKIVEYKDVMRVYSIVNNLFFTTVEQEYVFSSLMNPEEITIFINKKLKEYIKNTVYDVKKEEENYLKSKNKLIKRIIILVLAFVLAVANIFVCVFLTDGKEISEFTGNANVIFSVFVIIESFLLVFSLAFSKIVAKARLDFENAKIKYATALSWSLIDSCLSDKPVRIIRLTDLDRIVIYKTESGAYKCSHETFVLKDKIWYSYMLSDSFQLLDEVEEYLDNFKNDIIE